MKQSLQTNKLLKGGIILGDLCILNLLFLLLCHVFNEATLGSVFVDSLPQILVLLNLVYLVCNYSHGVILYHRIVRPDHIIRRAARNVILHALVFCTLFSLADFGQLSLRFFLVFYLSFFVCLTAFRLACRSALKRYRSRGGNSRSVILIGTDENMQDLYQTISRDSSYGFRVLGYFAPSSSRVYPEEVPFLGTVGSILPWLQEHPAEMVFCGLSSSYGQQILPVINYCENHFMHFYSVPSVRNYLKRRMYFELLGNVPVLAIRHEPLADPFNRFVKRCFDLLFSGLFLCTVFPFVYLIVGTAIKLSSPGPVFFRQKRTGLNGREFWCYKFRPMRVNADADRLQATLHDPRKTRIGEFIRKTSIDELPQFINVFRGDMSVVGPRPHMLKHTEQYSHIIEKYMVRHLVKPGITGWAQVNGFRGETSELWQMEGRVKLDIWYIEHWTPMLDLFIIYKTVRNAIHGEKEAY